MMSCACFRLAGPVSHTERFSLYYGNSCPFKPKICQSPVPIRAFELATRFRRPAAYDAHYLALAEHLACPFWTADERLYNSVRDSFPLIRWLGDLRL